MAIQNPAELRKFADVKHIVLGLFGGSEKKLDCWLSQTADILAEAGPGNIDLPPMLQPYAEWMKYPHEVVDKLIELFEKFGIWEADNAIS